MCGFTNAIFFVGRLKFSMLKTKNSVTTNNNEKDEHDEEDKEDDENTITSSTTAKITKREFDINTDATCVAVKTLFKKNPRVKITRDVSCIVHGKEVNVGKLIYTLRICYRHPKQNPLTKIRVKALSHI